MALRQDCEQTMEIKVRPSVRIDAAKIERERILELLNGFWCGEPACSKHPVRMDWVIAAIKGENK